MKTQTTSPFDGKPRTRLRYDADGNLTDALVRLSALTPFRAKVADRLSNGAAMAGAGWALFQAIQLPVPGHVAAGLTAAVTAGAWLAVRYGLRWALRRRVVCEFTREQFSYRTVLGRRRFDRNVPHRFVLYQHDKAEREEQRLSFLERKRGGKWWTWSPRRYYGNSYHLALEYMGQRRDITTVYGTKLVELYRSRLSALDDAMTAEGHHGGGIALSPENEWSPQPGRLPDNP